MIARKNILFVITKSNWGGAQKYVFTLATHLSNQGHNVTVALGGTGEKGTPTGLLAQRLQEAHIPIVFLTSFTRDISWVQDIRTFFDLLHLLRTLKPDVLHVNSSKAGGIGSLAGHIARTKRILFTAHGWAHREARHPLSKLLIWLSSWLTIIFSHTVIAVSKYDYDHAPLIFSRKKMVLIHNGIQIHPLPSHAQAKELLKQRIPSLPEDTPIIISVGELTKNKNHDVLIRSLAQINHPFFCIIIGEGEERTAITQLIVQKKLEGRVILPGFIPNASALLTAADIFVLPSRKEGLPYTLLEAGLASLAVVATHTGGIPEIISPQKTGILIPINNSTALASAIDTLLSDKNLRERLGTALHTHVINSFSEESTLQKTERLYA